MPIWGLDKIDLSEYASKDLPYVEQYKRMIRWHKAIQPIDINSGSYNFMPSYLTKEDIFFSFFTACYHFKDWLIGSYPAKEFKNKVEEYIKNSVSLTICDELCNQSKHLKLKYIKKKPQRNLDTKGYQLVVLKNAHGPGPSYHDSVYIIERLKKRLDALGVARDCIREWDYFLITYKIPKPTSEL